MPSPKSNRRGSEQKNRRGRLAEKSSSFHCRTGLTDSNTATSSLSQLRRPKTVPDLLPSRSLVVVETTPSSSSMKVMTKLLMKVTVQGSVGAVQVLIRPDSSVGELIAAALSQYVKEARRPILPAPEASLFNLHYSQFALECLDREEKLMELGSRNFFMCPRKSTTDAETTSCSSSSSSSSCATQADQVVTKSAFSWFKFMDFML